MPKFYAVLEGYNPNSAASIRFVGFLKRLSHKKIETDVIIFESDRNRSKLPELPFIHYNYYWKYLNVLNPKVQTLLYYLLYSRIFISKVKKGDTVYCYNCNELIPMLVRKKKIRVFHERTEHPEVSKHIFLNLKKYLRSCSRLTGLFVISEPLKTYFENIGVPKNKIAIINMTVDGSRFNGLEKKQSERYIAYCGKASNNKDGVDILIKAFSIVAKKIPDIKLYIVGAIPKANEEKGNIRLVEDLGLTERVIFTGVVDSKSVPQILKNAEVLALARPDNLQAKHGFPTKLGEYLLSSNPVVITAVGDIPKFLKNDINAYISLSDDAQAFAKKLLRALENPQKSKEIGERGRLLALEKFNSDIEGDKMLNMIFNDTSVRY